MAKDHPLAPVAASSSSSSSSYVTSERESFTIWMKSPMMQGNGSTVFNENGEIVYRIDNYDEKDNKEVYLKDLRGKVLYTILRKVWFLGGCEGYDGDLANSVEGKLRFQVSKKGRITHLSNNTVEVTATCYKLEVSDGKSAFRIRECRRGHVVTKAKRKQSSSGVLLGDDVLALVVKPQVDHSFIMALVTVYGLMHHRL